MRRAYIVLVLAALVLLAGCTAQIKTTDTITSQQAEWESGTKLMEIEIKGFIFNPEKITVKKGATVIWNQMDSAPHTVSSTSAPSGAAFDSGTLSKGDSWSHTFDKEGIYEYYCAIHPNMKGKIIVE